MSEDQPKALILYCGLAASEDVFVPQKIAFPELVVPKWPTPKRDDTLNSYCKRLADDQQKYKGVIIGGASFGGIIALHVAQFLDPLAVVLIGSVRSPHELSRFARLSRPLKSLVPLIPVRFLQLCCAPLTSKFVRQAFPHLGRLARQFHDCDAAVFKWSLSRILDWKVIPTVSCPVYHIHGDRDLLLPMQYTRPDVVVCGGGHVISLTHPTDVNEFIRSAMTRTEQLTNGIVI